MSVKRFIKFWLLDYVTATIVTFTIATTVVAWFALPSVVVVAYVYIPLNALWVARLAFRHPASSAALQTRPTHRWIIAGLWLLGDVVADFFMLRFLFGVANPVQALMALVPLIVYGAKYFAIILAAWLARRVATEMPSPRLELASQLSSAQRRQGRG